MGSTYGRLILLWLLHQPSLFLYLHKKGANSKPCLITYWSVITRLSTVVVGVRLTVGLYGTIVHRPSSPAVVAVSTQKLNFHPLWCSIRAACLHPIFIELFGPPSKKATAHCSVIAPFNGITKIWV
jgi:hypothetical protein